MSVVNLHPEELFDALRRGGLSASDRTRLEAHCTRCAVCRFELEWVNSQAHRPRVTAEDIACGGAGLRRVLPASNLGSGRRSQHFLTRSLTHSGLFNALVGASIAGAILIGRELWVRSTHSRKSSPADATLRSYTSPPPLIIETLPLETLEPDEPRIEHPIAAQSAPSANALLAAARQAHTLNDAEHARQLYERVIHAHSSTRAAATARVALGRLLFDDAKEPRAAIALFDAYLNRHPKGSLAEEALYYRALSLHRLGREDQARDGLNALLESFPDSLYAAPARRRLSTERPE